MTIAIFPGSFDPLTNGHLDLIKQTSKLFDEVIVAVAINTDKRALFTAEEKTELISENVKEFGNVKVEFTSGLLVHFAKERNADVIVRGIRNVKDYEYERDIFELNFQLSGIPTILLPSKAAFQDISSSGLKEIAQFGVDVSPFVPANVAKALKEKYEQEHK
ncbi:MAG: pantetheine-phosphate adenylyltransferase [Lactobacillaceae bacterium]|jgi:pantetheine-phosphate adenylyltransferase|nr:pantetheine-phosphate adenylyltransferase [Lactobacillaceae bacterium]